MNILKKKYFTDLILNIKCILLSKKFMASVFIDVLPFMLLFKIF